MVSGGRIACLGLGTLGCLASVPVLLAALLLGLERRDALYPGNGIDMPSSLYGKVALVTGSSSGLGYEAAGILLHMGAHVIVHSPSQERAARSAEQLMRNATTSAGRATPLSADLADFQAVRAMAEQVRQVVPKIDLLFLNAGFMYGPPPDDPNYMRALNRTPDEFVSPSGHDRVLAGNHLGHVLLVHLLSNFLTPAAKVVVTGSQGAWSGNYARLMPPWGKLGEHRFSEHKTCNFKRILWDHPGIKRHAYIAYYDSKLANVCYARSLRRLMKGKSVVLYDPGLVTAGTTAARDSNVYLKRLYKYTGWTDKNRAPVYDGGLHLVQSAFVTRKPMPDTVIAFFNPPEVFSWIAPPSMAGWRRLPNKWFVDRQKLTWGLHAGVGPGCGEDDVFGDMFLHWSAKEAGIFD